MPEVRLDTEEWQRVLGLLSQGPWVIANPLIMRIGDQLRAQAAVPDPTNDAPYLNEANRKPQ